MQTPWIYNAALSALFAGATAVIAKVGLAGVSSDLATLVRTAFVLVFLAILCFAGRGMPTADGLTTRTLFFLALSALTTALSWLFYYRALQAGPVAAVAAIDKGSLLVTTALAAIFLGEALTPRVAGGALLVAGGLWLMTVRA